MTPPPRRLSPLRPLTRSDQLSRRPTWPTSRRCPRRPGRWAATARRPGSRSRWRPSSWCPSWPWWPPCRSPGAGGWAGATWPSPFVMYVISGHGVTVGFHRYFTHGSFKANRGLRVGLAIAGSLSIEGPVVRWVADHRKHHAFSDREGDPHCALAVRRVSARPDQGPLVGAHGVAVRRRADLADQVRPRSVARQGHRAGVAGLPGARARVAAASRPLLGGLLSWSWQGAVTAFFWGSLVRIALLHHVTWSINSICHAIGERPFKSRDRSGNVWWLAFLSMGESWHNLHHADPTCARHGVLRGTGRLDGAVHLAVREARLGNRRTVAQGGPSRRPSRIGGPARERKNHRSPAGS